MPAAVKILFRITYLHFVNNIRCSGDAALKNSRDISPPPEMKNALAEARMIGLNSAPETIPGRIRNSRPGDRDLRDGSLFKQVGSNNKTKNACGYLAGGVLLITMISSAPQKISPLTVSPVNSKRLYAPISRGRPAISAMSNLATNWPRLSAPQD